MTAVADVQAGLVRATVEMERHPRPVPGAHRIRPSFPAGGGAPDVPHRRLEGGPPARRKVELPGQEPGDSEVRGEYLAIEPPRLLEYTWEPSWEQYRQTIIRCTLEAIPGGTRVSVVHRGFTAGESATGHAEGWTRVLGWLAGRFAGAYAL